ncbi:MAG: aspartate kinase [Bacteriovoracaceae bacterium]
MIKVFKFGGSLLSDPQKMCKVVSEIHSEKPTLVIISALKGMTNRLEELCMLLYQGKLKAAQKQFEDIKQDHITFRSELPLFLDLHENLEKMIFDELDQLCSSKLDQLICSTYDQVLSCGERLSSLYLHSQLENSKLFDSRDYIKTDSNFSNAKLDWDSTRKAFREFELEPDKLYISQGFIASDLSGSTTTLGREGSDYSATIYSNLMKANQVRIYTDVDGVFSTDPKKIIDAKTIPQLHFDEAHTFAKNGAKVLYPRTIEPLREIQTDLIVCSLDSSSGGTKINSSGPEKGFKGLIFNSHPTKGLLELILVGCFDKEMVKAMEADYKITARSFDRHEIITVVSIEESLESTAQNWHQKLFLNT